MTIYATITIQVEVTDPRALKRASEAQAISDGWTLEDWRRERPKLRDHLRNLFDQGAATMAWGIEINDSDAEVYNT
jgi:hypothetical protein